MSSDDRKSQSLWVGHSLLTSWLNKAGENKSSSLPFTTSIASRSTQQRENVVTNETTQASVSCKGSKEEAWVHPRVSKELSRDKQSLQISPSTKRTSLANSVAFTRPHSPCMNECCEDHWQIMNHDCSVSSHNAAPNLLTWGLVEPYSTALAERIWNKLSLLERPKNRRCVHGADVEPTLPDAPLDSRAHPDGFQ